MLTTTSNATVAMMRTASHSFIVLVPSPKRGAGQRFLKIQTRPRRLTGLWLNGDFL